MRYIGAALLCASFIACASGDPPSEDPDAGAATDAAPGAPDALVGNCPASDPDSDNDGVCDSADVCAGSNDAIDADNDTVPDGCDVCPNANDLADEDIDGVPDGCDLCVGFDDTQDADNDTVPDACDVCAGFDDTADADNDTVPDGCDICGGFDDTVDTDADTVPDGCDACAGYDDANDADADTVPDGCDVCPGFDDTVDSDNDGAPTGCDLCPGFNDAVDSNPANGIPDGCDCTRFQTSWCYQQGTMEQFTRCGSVTNSGFTCNSPEIKYGFLEGGIPRQHVGNQLDTWCQQLGYARSSNATYGQRNVAAPYGALFGCTSHDENTWHWCDWQDGYWYNELLDYHTTASTDITSLTCSDDELIDLTPSTGNLVETDDPYWASKGYLLTASQTINVTGFEWWINLPSSATIRARIYNSAGTLVATGTVATGQNSEQWYHSDISYTMQAGQTYTIAMYHSAASTGTFDRRDSPTQGFSVSPYVTNVNSRSNCTPSPAQSDVWPNCANTWAPYQRIIASP